MRKRTIRRSRKVVDTTGKGKPDEKDEVLFVSPNPGRGSSSRGTPWRGRGRGRGGSWRGRKPGSSVVECWNCGEKGHLKYNCPNPKKDDSPKKTGSANAAAESDSDGNGVWAVDTNCDSDGLMTTLDEVSDSEDEGHEVGIVDEFDVGEVDEFDVDVPSSFDGASESDGSFFGEEDWFSEPEEVSRNIEDDILRNTYNNESTSDQEDYSIPDEALTAAEPLKSGQYAFVQAELYDSGCTRHISPYREDFESFAEIPSMSFSAANKAKFNATGKDEIVIDIPVKTWNVGAAECGSGLRGCGVNFAELRTRPQLIGCALT